MAFIRGSRRDDFLEGTFSRDLIYGRSGDDEILGGGGGDWIFGGRGRDTLDGEGGNDWLFGGNDDDLVRGGDGRDRMFGGRGNDDLFGGDDDDFMVGNSGRDSLFGGEGDDRLYGDEIFSFRRRGGDDDDDGGRRGGGDDDDDGAKSKAYDDFLDGGEGDDKLFGGHGDDTLDGGEGADKMVGGTGDDTYFVDDAGDRVFEKSRQGTDEVFSSVDYTLADNVENLTLLEEGGEVRSSYETDFEGFTTGVSIDGQDGWGVAGPPTFDESVEDDSGNTVWRVSNAVTSGAFGNQPFAPRPAGIVADTTTDPVNGDPDSFAGESSTGASSNRFFAQFDFASATGAAQPGLSITVSPDNGSGARHGFFDLQDTGSGLEVVTFDLDSGGNFIGPITIADGLSYTDFHTIGIEIIFNDGPNDDVVNYFLDGELIHTGPSWEQFYTNFQDALHPSGVPVQSLIFRVSGAAEGSVEDDGFFIDNLSYEIGSSAADLNGTGNALDNELTGNSGGNILSGLGGDDLIFGGGGNDNLIGGEDDDELDGGGGNDTATFSGDAADYDVTVLPDGRIQVSDNVPGRDGTDTLENIEQLDFNGTVLPLGPVLVFDAGNTFVGGFSTIQAGVDASSDGFTVLVTPGTYNENVEIDSSISLLSTGGRESTIIQGSVAPGGAETGTVYILDDTDNVQIGDVGQGFTIVGFDNPAPGIETAAVYISGDQDNIDIIDNEIVADGEAGVLTEWAAAIDGLTIDKNVFSGTTFDPSQPVSETQWTTNFPWAMLFVGNAPTKSNIVVTDNTFEGQTAGETASGETFGNVAATVDATGATITGNTFATDANNFGLRARGTDTEVSDNTFDNSGDGNTTGFTLDGATPSGPYADNVFIGGENGDVFFGTPGEDDISGNDGGDLLGGGLGDDNIDGGDGNDTAFFLGAGSDYSFVFGIDGNPISATDTNPGDGDEGTDTLTSIENVFFLGEDPVQVFDTTGNFVASFTTIQAGIDAALDGYTVLVGPGTYVENIEIVDKDISVFSVAGRDSTIIEGIPGSALGTVFLGGVTDGVQFGREGQGFKVIGFDGPPGIEKGAFYASSSGAPGHTDLGIEGNEFVANGDSALTFEFNDHFDGVTIEGNVFSGFTFDPTQPIGDPNTFSNQFITENVARQLVVIGGGSGVTNTQNVDFVDNEITGTTGGVVETGETFNDAGTPTVAGTDIPFGNTMVTIDVVGGSVSGNSFTGTTGRFGAGLRVRGPGTDITDNTFDNGDGGDTRGVFQQTFDGTYADNEFIGGDGNDLFAGSAGDDILIGGLGADTQTGGDGADTFVVAAGDGGPSLALADLITDWEDGVDKIGLAGGLTFGDLTIGSDGGDATISVGAEVLAVVDGAAGLIEATDFVGA